MHVKKTNLFRVQVVMLLERPSEFAEVARHLSLGGDGDRGYALGERPVLGGKLEPIDQGSCPGERSRIGHFLGAHPKANTESHEQPGMGFAPGNQTCLFFIEALSALHSRCLDPTERQKLAESLYEEETGGCERMM